MNTVANRFDDATSQRARIPIEFLTGTPIALGSPVFVMPESPLGVLLALSVCFVAVAAFTAFKKKMGKQPAAIRRNVS
jgi:hypothetical protein